MIQLASEAQAITCEEAASLMSGNTITACGVGENKLEERAREIAHKNAYKEFQMICRSSDGCIKQQIKTVPMRNHCIRYENGYKCYRAVKYIILEEEREYSKNDIFLAETIAERQSQLDGLDKHQGQVRRLAYLDRSLKFKRKNPSYWNLGIGLSLTSDQNYGGFRKSGYHFKYGRCFLSNICTSLETAFGNISRSKGSGYGGYGSWISGAGVIDFWLNKNLFIPISLGREKSGYKFAPNIVQNFASAGLGVAANPHDYLTVTFQVDGKRYLDRTRARDIVPGMKVLMNIKW